jgi:hypothetical protein
MERIADGDDRYMNVAKYTIPNQADVSTGKPYCHVTFETISPEFY